MRDITRSVRTRRLAHPHRARQDGTIQIRAQKPSQLRLDNETLTLLAVQWRPDARVLLGLAALLEPLNDALRQGALRSARVGGMVTHRHEDRMQRLPLHSRKALYIRRELRNLCGEHLLGGLRVVINPMGAQDVMHLAPQKRVHVSRLKLHPRAL